MKRSTPPPIPQRGAAKRYSLNQVIGSLAIAIVVTFIFGTIFGLKIGSHPDRSATISEHEPETEAEVPSIPKRPTLTPEQEAAWDRDAAARRAATARQGAYGTGSGAAGYTGKHPIDAYSPEADGVARHWEKETGQPMSQSDVETIQWLMKTIDDKE